MPCQRECHHKWRGPRNCADRSGVAAVQKKKKAERYFAEAEAAAPAAAEEKPVRPKPDRGLEPHLATRCALNPTVALNPIWPRAAP